MTTHHFRGGGPLDGRLDHIPAGQCAHGTVTTDRDATGSIIEIRCVDVGSVPVIHVYRPTGHHEFTRDTSASRPPEGARP